MKRLAIFNILLEAPAPRVGGKKRFQLLILKKRLCFGLAGLRSETKQHMKAKEPTGKTKLNLTIDLYL